MSDDYACTHPGKCSHPSPEVIMHSVQENIRKNGYSVMGVLPDEDHYPFTYTTGLGEHLDGHPELTVLGLDNHLAHHVIHAIAEYLKQGGKMPQGERVIIDKMPFRLEPVDLLTTWMDFSATTRYYRDRDGWELKVMQIIWPDDKYLLPGEDGVDPVCVQAQDPVNLPAD